MATISVTFGYAYPLRQSHVTLAVGGGKIGFISKLPYGTSEQLDNESRSHNVKMLSKFCMCPLLIRVFNRELLCAKASTAKTKMQF